MTLIVIIAVMTLTVAFTGMCSLNPGRPENGSVQEVDARQFLDIEARGMAFPLRYPQMPDGWTTNSARRSSVDGAPAPVVGWVTAQGAYVQLLQTDRPRSMMPACCGSLTSVMYGYWCLELQARPSTRSSWKRR